MENDDLFEILDAPENNENTSEIPNSDFVQDESFVNSLDFQNGFSDVSDEDINKLLDEIDDEFKDLSDDASETIDETNEDIISDIDVTKEDIPDASQDIILEENTSDISDTSPEEIIEESDNSQISDDMTDQPQDNEDFDEDLDDEEYEQTMVITEGTVITGSISTDCSLDVYGTIEGDIFCKGKLSVSGKVKGDSHADEVMINAPRTEGKIECTGVVKIGQGSVVIGDISAGAAVIAGAVKGTLDIMGPVILDSTAVIKGNIKAKSVQLINGAILEGFCSVEYSNPQVDEIFQ